MPTTAAVLLEIAKALRCLSYGTATGGSSTTLVDLSASRPTGYYDRGTIFFLSGNNAGRTAVITNWNATTHTFTFVTPGAACAIGDEYAALDPRYPRSLLVDALNRALVEIGPFATNNTSLTSLVDTVDYALPSGVYNVLRVERATATAAPYGWKIHYQWREVNGRLYFLDHAPAEGYLLRLWHEAPHLRAITDDMMSDVAVDEMAYYTATVTDNAHPALLAAIAAYYVVSQRLTISGNDERLKDFARELQVLEQMARTKYPVQRMERDPIMAFI
jgi:hypothetical protein